MIVSHKHKFIFIKTGKVGGTSLEIALSKFLGPDDIVTPVSRVDEEKRLDLGFRGSQNFQKRFSEMGSRDLMKVAGYWALLPFWGERERIINRRRLPRRFWNHIDASRARSLLGEDVWNNYYKITVERNPWDKVVSMYFWDQKKARVGQEFRDFVQSGTSYQSDFDLYSISGIPQVDKFIFYEELEKDLGEVSDNIGISENIYNVMSNIRAKGDYRKERDYKSFYDDELKRIVEFQYGREINLLGYDFT